MNSSPPVIVARRSDELDNYLDSQIAKDTPVKEYEEDPPTVKVNNNEMNIKSNLTTLDLGGDGSSEDGTAAVFVPNKKPLDEEEM